MPLLRSWIDSANDAGTEFPLNNLPCGVFSVSGGEARCGVAIGDCIVDVARLEREGVLAPAEMPVFARPAWNDFMALGPDAWSAFRARLIELLAEDGALREAVEPALVPLAEAALHMPFAVAEFTDFYAGRHHAENVGTMFRGPDNALPPNWLHMPIGYNGRASSVVVSGTGVRRPWGQIRPDGDGAPIFAPSRRFDFELEIGTVVGQASAGPVTVDEADAMIFGYVLLNDWSARDIQAWEYVPLGPFQSKATATTIGPWIVMAEALEPFRTMAPPRAVPLLEHLRDTGPMLYDVALQVDLAPAQGPATTVTRTNMAELYYSPAQQLAHHTTCGCPMSVGDLLGTGTISGPERGNRGSLLELSWGGREPLEIGGATRAFLEDGDTVTMRGAALGDGFRIGFGTCEGTLLPALPDPYGRP